MYGADGNTGGMQNSGGEHKPETVEQRVLTRRQFGTVRVSVEETEVPTSTPATH